MKIEDEQLSSLITVYSSAEEQLIQWYSSFLFPMVGSCSSLKELTDLWDQVFEVCNKLGVALPGPLHVEYVFALNKLKFA